MNIAYIRVSTVDQNLDRQDFPGVQIDRTYEDKMSGAKKDRPGLNACLEHLREGDTLHVHSIDRLARDVRHLRELIDDLNEQGVTIHFHRENLIFDGKHDAMSRLMLQMLGAFAEFERDRIRERQAEGIAKAKNRPNNPYKGRRPSIDKEAITKALQGGMSMRKTAEYCNVSLSTVQRVAKGL